MRVDMQRMAVIDYPARDDQFRSEPQESAEVKRRDRAAENKNDKPVDAEKLRAAIELTNDAIRITNYHLEFRLHQDSGRYQVKVIDSQSQEVIREIPPEKMLEFSAHIKQLLDKAMGLLVDEIA
ncbi:MAG TPA: flagellar protein FlaG [Syntrophomonadaceae bacterium]|nr:flagellar protein FlaG [Syntrophomonadaceae bacterium]HOQ10415.1 flagellar protein FlaG [Syntrophomonadaceae bacterium]